MENLRVIARRVAAIAAGGLFIGSSAVLPTRANPANGAKAKPAAGAPETVNNSVWRPFGMVNGLNPTDALAKDASGHYTNPDAITAYTALTLYVAGALRFPLHPPNEANATLDPHDQSWDYANRFAGVDNPGRLTSPIRVDDYGNLASQGGRLTSLVDMFKQGDDHTKAIIVAVVRESHDQVHRAMLWDVGRYASEDTPGLYGSYLHVALDDTTDAKLTAITARIAGTGIDPYSEQGQEPAPPNQSVMNYIQGTTDSVLDASRPYGGVVARFKQVFQGPQPQNLIATRTLVASLVGIPYPPGAQVAPDDSASPTQVNQNIDTPENRQFANCIYAAAFALNPDPQDKPAVQALLRQAHEGQYLVAITAVVDAMVDATTKGRSATPTLSDARWAGIISSVQGTLTGEGANETEISYLRRAYNTPGCFGPKTQKVTQVALKTWGAPPVRTASLNYP